jgi:drug/metabolite transporter (DMT)-like permease
VSQTRARPTALYVAAALGGSYSVVAALIGAANQNLFILAHGTLGLLLYATVAARAPVFARTRHPRLWISLILALTILLALSSLSVTSLIGYTPAGIVLVVSAILGTGNERNQRGLD